MFWIIKMLWGFLIYKIKFLRNKCYEYIDKVVFTYCAKPRLKRPQVFYDFHDFFSKFLQNKRSGKEVSCLHIVLPRLLRPLRLVGYHHFLMMLLPHDQFDCVLIDVVRTHKLELFL